MTQYTTIEFRREAKFEERYMELTGANTLDTLIFFNDAKWHKTPEGRYVKRSVLREQRAAWCLNFLSEELNDVCIMDAVRYRCNEHTVCEFCRAIRVKDEKKILAQVEQLYYIETNEDNEEALKKVCKRAKGKFRRYPRINNVISIVVTKQIKGVKPVTHDEVGEQLDTWVKEIDTLNGKKISGTLREPTPPIKDDEDEKGNGDGEPKEEEGEIQVMHAVINPEICSKQERNEVYEQVREEMHGKSVYSFEDLETANREFMKLYIDKLGEINPEYVVDYYTTYRRVTTNSIKVWNRKVSTYSVLSKDSNTEKMDTSPSPTYDPATTEAEMYEEWKQKRIKYGMEINE